MLKPKQLGRGSSEGQLCGAMAFSKLEGTIVPASPLPLQGEHDKTGSRGLVVGHLLPNPTSPWGILESFTECVLPCSGLGVLGSGGNLLISGRIASFIHLVPRSPGARLSSLSPLRLLVRSASEHFWAGEEWLHPGNT